MLLQALTAYSYVYGGMSPNNTALGDLHILTLPSFQWISVNLANM